jgi:transposase
LLEKRLKDSTRENEQFSTTKKQLQSIVGIGEKTAHRLIAYLPDLSTFRNAKQLAAYAGLSPRQFQSGAYTGKTKISKF